MVGLYTDEYWFVQLIVGCIDVIFPAWIEFYEDCIIFLFFIPNSLSDFSTVVEVTFGRWNIWGRGLMFKTGMWKDIWSKLGLCVNCWFLYVLWFWSKEPEKNWKNLIMNNV
jgi:hypothetical protein